MVGGVGRVWFVNSVKFVNFNVADIYSFDPETRTARYERQLFSQDAGTPVIVDDLLYWPFEDPRFTIGWGECMVTDGTRWRWRSIPGFKAYHVHTLAVHDRALYAATSAWRARLLRSTDRGRSWTLVHDHPTPEGYVSRITVLASFKGALYAGMTSRATDGPKLMRLTADELVPVEGWPAGRRVTALARHRGWLYALNRAPDRNEIWRTDGNAVVRVASPDDGRVRHLYADDFGLFALTANDGTGAVWRWGDGAWRMFHRFDAAEPADMTGYRGRLYVGTIGPDGRGTLWGTAAAPAMTGPVRRAVLGPTPTADTMLDSASADATLTRLLADSTTFQGFTDGLRPLLHDLAIHRSAAVNTLLVNHLEADHPAVPVSLFGGNLQTTTDRIARWALLWAIGANGAGCLPVRWLEVPWRAPVNAAEKYLEPAPAAAWAVGQLGQNDAATIGALMTRLDAPGDPAWLRGDIVGALTALTGKRFGHDPDAWRNWWTVVADTWQPRTPACPP